MRSAIVILAMMLTAGAAHAAGSDELLMVAPDQVPLLWHITKQNISVRVQPSDIAYVSNACAAVSFVIESDGSTSTVKVRRSVPRGLFVEAAGKVVRQMRFEPTKLNVKRTPVYTYIVVSFGNGTVHTLGSHIDGHENTAKLKKACAIREFETGHD